MAMQNITYTDKVDLNTTAVADINKVNASDMNQIKNVVNNNTNLMNKTLWEGSFSTGTLNVPEISNYTVILVFVGNVMMVGNQRYGGTPITTYQQLTISNFAYRYTYNATNETLTTDNDNPGATNGTSRQTITKIVGLI